MNERPDSEEILANQTMEYLKFKESHPLYQDFLFIVKILISEGVDHTLITLNTIVEKYTKIAKD